MERGNDHSPPPCQQRLPQASRGLPAHDGQKVPAVATHPLQVARGVAVIEHAAGGYKDRGLTLFMGQEGGGAVHLL